MSSVSLTTTHLLGLLVQTLLNRRPSDQLLIPLIALGILALPLLLEIRMNETQHTIPRHKHQVGVRNLVADEILVASLGKVSVDDTLNTIDLLAVTFDG